MTDIPEDVMKQFDPTGRFLEPEHWAIPEDVMTAAREHIDAIRDAVIDEYHEVKADVTAEALLAKAILAERERWSRSPAPGVAQNSSCPAGGPNPPSAFGGHRRLTISRA